MAVSAEIIVAILSLVGTLFVSLTGVLVSSKLTQFRLEQLEQKVGKVMDLGERIALVEQSVKSAHKRIDTYHK